MIGWYEVASNAIWIVGCALALATISYADWLADQRHEKLRAQFARPNLRLAIELSLTLFCLGLAATSTTAIAILIWIILTVWSAIQLVRDWLTHRRAARN
jgi:phosphatidylglycerophosphate synthase